MRAFLTQRTSDTVQTSSDRGGHPSDAVLVWGGGGGKAGAGAGGTNTDTFLSECSNSIKIKINMLQIRIQIFECVKNIY